MPPTPSLWLAIVDGFSASSLLKCVLARCRSPDVISKSLLLQKPVIWGAGVVPLGAKNISLGMPASTSTPWTTIERSKVAWEHKKGDLGVRACIFIDLKGIWGHHFGSFWGTVDQYVCVFLYVCSHVIFPRYA